MRVPCVLRALRLALRQVLSERRSPAGEKGGVSQAGGFALMLEKAVDLVLFEYCMVGSI